MPPFTNLEHVVRTEGPFFSKDPGRTFRQNERSFSRALVLAGQADVQEQMAFDEGRRALISNDVQPPRVREHVVASIPYSASGDLLGTTIKANVFVQNRGFTARQAIALMAAYSEVEKETHAFRMTTNRLWMIARREVGQLLKGIA